MLVYAKTAQPKAPKRRSRAGCIHCKEKKKKCNEKRPSCDRCLERNLQCEYELVRPRKRRTSSFLGDDLSQQSNDDVSISEWDDKWHSTPTVIHNERTAEHAGIQSWDTQSEDCLALSEGTFQAHDASFPPTESSFQGEDCSEDGIDEIVRGIMQDSPTSQSLVRSTSQYPDLAMTAPSPVASPLTEFFPPVYAEFSEKPNRRALVDHFCSVLSHLIVLKEDNGNPFRQLILPLSHRSPPVMNALLALSSAHLERKGLDSDEKSVTFHNKALQGLSSLIAQNEYTRKEEILGAIMLLVYYEVLLQRENFSIVSGHLKGAMTILTSGPPTCTPTAHFLERAFRFYDVITALSLGTSPTAISDPPNFQHQANHDFANLNSNSPFNAVDTLLGLTTDLWPIIHRMAQLKPVKDSMQAAIASGNDSAALMLSTELDSTVQSMELALANWNPPFPGATIADSTRFQTIVNNAEAYRHSAYVYLYRTIKSLPRSHILVQQHAHLAILACSNTVVMAEKCHNGPMSALLWPLVVASCEAITEESRSLATDAFERSEKRQGMENIAIAWGVVQELWWRADANQDIDVDWREICEEKGVKIVLG